MTRFPTLLLFSWCALLSGQDALILQVPSGAVRGGKSSFVADVQQRLNALSADCRPTPPLSSDGQFGPGLRTAIMKAAGCASFKPQLPAGTLAHKGALTEAMWLLLFPGRAVPGLHERAMVIVLTQEGTDYDRAEWNYCQSKPLFNPAQGQPVCFSNDKKSYLTWGPRGATAGHGAEVQQVLHAIDSDPQTRPLLDTAFGPFAASVRRMNRLNEADTERFLCVQWLNPATRQGWSEGFRKLGPMAQVRAAYDTVYASSTFDGAKIQRYYDLYRAAGVVPTEVDYAYFVDRATHMSAPAQATIASARAQSAGVSPARLRRWLALNHRPANQRADRLGRDVVFYVDALEASLTPEEINAWRARNPFRAANFGLSDSVTRPEFRAEPLPFPKPPRGDASLTADERAACPAAVLAPRDPPPSR